MRIAPAPVDTVLIPLLPRILGYLWRASNPLQIFLLLSDHLIASIRSTITMAAKIGGKKITPYNIFILMFVGLGSMTYGYTASIIGTTLGKIT